ncbi:DUF6252 family protein [Pedobacter jamesrossensis]|uniref:DUF6252 family protein n=1 Tax=Pedobacter jamesrossensis TaxID=1908238 RepID=A0ABV8NPH9_9SPHI
MKVSFKLFALALICLFFTQSCKKVIDYHPEWNTSSMSAKIDGILLECTLATAQFYNIGTQTSVQISGIKEVSGFSLMINDFKGVGTYSVADNNIATYLSSNTGPSESYMANAIGMIKITSYTDQKIITGTFEFKGENVVTSAAKTISEGKFSINLVPIKLPETNNGTNNLTAKVDGVVMGFTGEAVLVNLPPIENVLSILTINGEKHMAFGIVGYKGVGTYNLETDGNGGYKKDQTPSGSFSSESGTLVITSDANNRIKGTFAFKAPNDDSSIKTSVNVTEGSFDLPFSKK